MRSSRLRELLGLSLALGFGASAVAGGIARDAGWWVVLGALPNPDLSKTQDAKIAKIRAAAARCGHAPFNDFSNKFRGFAPGYDVVVLGAFDSRAKARAVLRAVSPCVPGAYLAIGKYLGE